MMLPTQDISSPLLHLCQKSLTIKYLNYGTYHSKEVSKWLLQVDPSEKGYLLTDGHNTFTQATIKTLDGWSAVTKMIDDKI
jgi:hypothetical protein